MVAIKSQLVGTPSKRTFSGTNPVNFITVHETANKSAGADAQAHASLQSRYGVAGSWHYTVDDQHAIQSYLDTAQCWHAGDGAGPGNKESIGIEICVNSDGDYKKAVQNAAELVAMLMKRHRVPLSRVVQHNRFSPFGKNCPTILRSGSPYSWTDFLDMVEAAYGGAAVDKPVTKPPASGLAVDGWWGKGTTTALQKALGTPVDGEVWSQSMRWEADNPGLTSGWKWTDDPKGSRVMAALQAWLGLSGENRDGLIGPTTIKALQRKLKAMGYYNGSIDGELWKQSATIKALQKALNDGKVKA